LKLNLVARLRGINNKNINKNKYLLSFSGWRIFCNQKLAAHPAGFGAFVISLAGYDHHAQRIEWHGKKSESLRDVIRLHGKLCGASVV